MGPGQCPASQAPLSRAEFPAGLSFSPARPMIGPPSSNSASRARRRRARARHRQWSKRSRPARHLFLRQPPAPSVLCESLCCYRCRGRSRPGRRRCGKCAGRRRGYGAEAEAEAAADVVGAEKGVTAADLVLAVVRGFTKFGVWLREHGRLRHCQYSCHYDLGILRCFASSAGLPCLPALTAPGTPGFSSCATRSLCSSARPGHRSCPGPIARSCPRWPGCCPAAIYASCA
jgi:hypothetical protein